jgi:hypothetical protein
MCYGKEGKTIKVDKFFTDITFKLNILYEGQKK